LSSDSRLHEAQRAERFPVVSWHHQALRDMAPALRPVAWAEDQVIEAAEHVGHPWLVCVQWHPEMTTDQVAVQQWIFDAMVEAIRGQQPTAAGLD
jgi:putative glutamine amidotransferase